MFWTRLLVFLLLVEGIVMNDPENQLQRDMKRRSLNILMLSLPTVGHLTPTLAFVYEAVSRGHNVTICMGLAAEEFSKYKNTKSCHYELYESNITANLVKMVDARRGLFSEFYTKADILSEYLALMMQKLSVFMAHGKFDVTIGDEYMVASVVCAGSRWNTPAVIIGSLTQIFFHQYPPWAWPGLVQARESDNLPYYGRILATLDRIVGALVFKYILMAPYKKAMEEICPSISLDEFSTAPGHSVPHIVPTVIGFEFPRTLSPLTEYVGPLLRKNPSPINQDLKNWLEIKPQQSVVYISMGSKFKLAREQGRALLQGVKEANLSLVWSLRKSNQWVLDGMQLDVDQVYISEWTSQFSILASRAIHSAILHGGFNGLNEALSNGVPVLGIPCTDEQRLNVGRLYHSGLGMRLELDHIELTGVTNALLSLGSKHFRLKLNKLKKMFKLAGGPKRAVDLVEMYAEVGYDHLIPAYVKYRWTWIQYYNADVWLSVVSGWMLLLFLVRKCYTTCLRKCCRSFYKVKMD